MADRAETGGIVEYFGHGGGHRCGYCSQSSSNHSHGMHLYHHKTDTNVDMYTL